MKLFVIGMMCMLYGIMAFATNTERQNAIRESYVLEGKLNYAGAIKTLATQYNKEPNDYFINLRMGWLNYLLGNWKNAVQHYNSALEAKSKSMTAGIGKVNTLMAARDWNAAEDAAKTLAKVYPGDFTVQIKLANIYLIEKKYGDGLDVTKDLMDYYPENVELLNTHGYLYMLDGKKEKAEKVFHQVLSISPDNAIAKGHLTELAKKS